MNDRWVCFHYVGIPLDSLRILPIQQRNFYINKHIESVKKEKEYVEGNKSKDGWGNVPLDINKR